MRIAQDGDTWSSDNKDFYVFQVDESHKGKFARNQE
jgi:hypothetical protein